MVADWLSLGLGVVQEIRGAVAAGGNGVAVASPAVSYHIGEGPAQGSEMTIPVIVVNVEGTHAELEEGILMGRPIAACSATISITGTFAPGGEHPPVVANVQMWCSEQTGNWGTGNSESELLFNADAMPTAVGTPEDPHIEFRCRTELKIPQWDNVIVHFQVWVNSIGMVSFGQPTYEYGRCDVYEYGTIRVVAYDANRHAEAAH